MRSVKPFFSVILPTFNRATLLPRAVDSLLAQSMQDWDLLVVDDGSIDETAELMTRYSRQDSRIRAFHKANSGAASARNFGLQYANGKYVAFIDSDDFYLCEHLAIRHDVLLKNPSTRFLMGGILCLGSRFVPDNTDYSKVVDLEDSNIAVGGSFVIDTATLRSIGGFPSFDYSEDGGLRDKLVRSGISPLIVTAKTYIYDRTTPDSICTKLQSKVSANLTA